MGPDLFAVCVVVTADTDDANGVDTITDNWWLLVDVDDEDEDDDINDEDEDNELEVDDEYWFNDKFELDE